MTNSADKKLLKSKWNLSEKFTSNREVPTPNKEIQQFIDKSLSPCVPSDPELCYEIKEILESFSKLQRQCFESYYYDGLTQFEVGEKLNISRSTVSTHLDRARVKIEDAFGSVHYFMQLVERFSETIQIRLYIEDNQNRNE